jgi:hypothetical protein
MSSCGVFELDLFIKGKKITHPVNVIHWTTSPMGLLGCPTSFQQLMEGVLRNISNVLVYIDDLHTDTHKKHLKVLDEVLACLHILEDKSGEMRLWKQAFFLPRFYTHT